MSAQVNLAATGNYVKANSLNIGIDRFTMIITAFFERCLAHIQRAIQ